MHGLSRTNTIKVETDTLTNFKALTKRILTILVIAQLAYLLIINGALRLSITQDLVNKIKPEKFQVSWERAWSFYPLRVHAEGITANGPKPDPTMGGSCNIRFRLDCTTALGVERRLYL